MKFIILAQGGTAVGTGINSRKGWDKKIALKLKKLQTSISNCKK